jgi:flagellar motor protein MotB
MFRRRKSEKKVSEGENPFLLSFSDFMASLLAIFILIVIVMVVQMKVRQAKQEQHQGIWISEEANKDYENLKKLRTEVFSILQIWESFLTRSKDITKALEGTERRNMQLKDMICGIRDDLRNEGIYVIADTNNMSIKINDENDRNPNHKKLRFDSGQCAISKDYQDTANQIGAVLYKVLKNTNNLALLDTVFIEGHTDSQNYQIRDKSGVIRDGNWTLSTERAISLWEFWISSPGRWIELKELKSRPLNPNMEPKPLISVSGYGSTRSTHSSYELKTLNDDRAEDRRIEIRFTLAPSEELDLKNAESKWDNLNTDFQSRMDRIKQILNAR